jgi:hypothetical protein
MKKSQKILTLTNYCAPPSDPYADELSLSESSICKYQEIKNIKQESWFTLADFVQNY